MGRLTLTLLLLAFVALAPPAHAADSNVTIVPPPAAVVVAPAPAVAPVPPVVVTKPPPRVQYGCKRIWRCDKQVCEWRRGCWGVYGYMEGPYYSQELAKRQWEHDGWPGSGARAAGGAAVHLDRAK